MQNSSAATRQPSFHLRQGAERTTGFFFFLLGRAGSFIFFFYPWKSIFLRRSKLFLKRWWKLFRSPHSSPSLCVAGAFLTNLRRIAELLLATRTPTLMGFLCLSRLDKCSSVSQMPPETTVAGTSRTCASNSSFSFPPLSYPERRPRLKRDCTSLPCSVFPQCTWSTLSRPSPTPWKRRSWWMGAVANDALLWEASFDGVVDAYGLARAERARFGRSFHPPNVQIATPFCALKAPQSDWKRPKR